MRRSISANSHSDSYYFPNPTLVASNQFSDSALLRTWKYAFYPPWIIFLFYQAFIGLNHHYSERPLCRGESEFGVSNIFYSLASSFSLGCYTFSWILLVAKTVLSEAKEERLLFSITLSIVTFGLISSSLQLFVNWGGICVDVLGVATHAATWGEWFAGAPLLIYLTVAVVEKRRLSSTSTVIIVACFLAFVTGFIIIIPQPKELGIVWLVFSILLLLPTFFLSMQLNCFKSVSRSIYSEYTEIDRDPPKFFQNLLWCLTITFPLFAVNYFLGISGVFSHSQTVSVFLLLSAGTKGLFAVIVTEVHESIFAKVKQLVGEDRRVTEMRREFLKFIFEEVRNPLNSLSMGIELLNESERLNPIESECLIMMKSASDIMEEAMNDLADLQKLEEGILELDYDSFSIRDCVALLINRLRGAANEKHITLQYAVMENVPLRLVGDRPRIGYVMQRLVRNAIKFSPQHDTVVVHVSCSSQENGKAVITVSVSDRGPGISLEDQAQLFTSFAHVRQQQDGLHGNGLSLTLCKKVVALHGGNMGVESVEDEGATFYFSIPFLVDREANNRPIWHENELVEAESRRGLETFVESDVIRDSFVH